MPSPTVGKKKREYVTPTIFPPLAAAGRQIRHSPPIHPPTHPHTPQTPTHLHGVARRLQPLEEAGVVALPQRALAHHSGRQLHRVAHQVDLLGSAVGQRHQRGGLHSLRGGGCGCVYGVWLCKGWVWGAKTVAPAGQTGVAPWKAAVPAAAWGCRSAHKQAATTCRRQGPGAPAGPSHPTLRCPAEGWCPCCAVLRRAALRPPAPPRR